MWVCSEGLGSGNYVVVNIKGSLLVGGVHEGKERWNAGQTQSNTGISIIEYIWQVRFLFCAIRIFIIVK